MRNVRQDPDDHFRRWFYNDNFDLIVWYKPNGTVHGFQLSYDKTGHEKALTWLCGRGLSHHSVDTGESSPLANRTPILCPEENRSAMPRVLALFEISAKELPSGLRMLVVRKIKEYGRLYLPLPRHWEAVLFLTLFAAGFMGAKIIADRFLYQKK